RHLLGQAGWVIWAGDRGHLPVLNRHMEASRRVLRIAPVMTGGTSLAVWMGGATVELYRLLRATGEDRRGDRGTADSGSNPEDGGNGPGSLPHHEIYRQL